MPLLTQFDFLSGLYLTTCLLSSVQSNITPSQRVVCHILSKVSAAELISATIPRNSLPLSDQRPKNGRQSRSFEVIMTSLVKFNFFSVENLILRIYQTSDVKKGG